MTDSAVLMAIAEHWRDVGYAAELARLGHGNNLAGAVAAHPAAGVAGHPSDSSAPAPANTTSMGAGSAPDPDPAAVCQRGSGSRRGTPAPAPIEPLAFTGGAGARREGPPAS